MRAESLPFLHESRNEASQDGRIVRKNRPNRGMILRDWS
jgi:hypothetical protein